MDEEKDEIAKLLEEYQKQRSSKESSREPDAPLPPPVRRTDIIDFAKKDEEPAKSTKGKKREKTPEEQEALLQKKQERKENLKNFAKNTLLKIKAVIFNKITLIIILAIAVIIGGFFAIKAIIHSSQTAYLKPYEQRYDIEFPEGILEDYCDYYGENQSTTGFLKISDINLSTPVYTKDSKEFPAAEDTAEGAEQNNFVIYLQDKSLEKIYATAEGYNSSSAEIYYSDLFNEYSFRVVGAFYTNMNVQDDNGYIFPYNTTEKMTAKSAGSFAERIGSRLLYDTKTTITRQDRLILISCPTDYRDNFRFVVVGIMRNTAQEKPEATARSNVHFPQIIYDEGNQNNPYNFSLGWYPEYEITDGEGNIQTVQTELKDYQFKHPIFK